MCLVESRGDDPLTKKVPETRPEPEGIDPGWDYNPGAAHVRRSQRGLIAKLDARGIRTHASHNTRTAIRALVIDLGPLPVEEKDATDTSAHE